jgi:prepilin-type N-terminal cleavage/methylation domain-containing protein
MILARRPSRRAFTLVELLVVIMIITIMATMVMFAMAGVTEKARIDRTKAQIAKINELIMEKWESYQTRRVQWRPGAPGITPAQQRLYALRELLRMELPDRIMDVWDDPVSLKTRPALSRAYRTQALKANYWFEPDPNDRENFGTYQDSECLYLILSQMRDGEFSALEFFSENEIGDLDGDGMPEILDAWGTPIGWLRWAPGFVSPTRSDVQRSDYFDPGRADPRYLTDDPTDDPYEIWPLIYSAGPDKEPGIAFQLKDKKPIHWRNTTPPNDPYHEKYRLIGLPDGDKSLDNIHNHLIETR